jgi:hypothetical protein
MLPGFVKYIKTLNIDEESIINAANFITLKYVEKENFIFNQMDDSDAFYGIIEGEVSIQNETYQYEEYLKEGFFKKKVKINLKAKKSNHEKYTLKEEVIMNCQRGYCFGEWGLVYDAKRTSSAKAIHNTYLWVLNKRDFKLTLHQSFIKILNERKIFIKNTIQPFQVFNMLFDKLSKHIIPYVNISNIVPR